MEKTRVIEFDGGIKGDSSVQFLRIVLPATGGPLALVQVAIRGVEQDLGLRMDIQKQVFLDTVERVESETLLERAAPDIVRFLHDSRIRKNLERKKLERRTKSKKLKARSA